MTDFTGPTEPWIEKKEKSADIPPVRLPRFGSEDLSSARKYMAGMMNEISCEVAIKGGCFPRPVAIASQPLDIISCVDPIFSPIVSGVAGSSSYRVMLQCKERSMVSPWSDVPLWTSDNWLRVVCKTPRGRWAELDVVMEDKGGASMAVRVRKGQLAHYSVDAPWHVCLLPQTWADPDLANLNYGGLLYDGRPIEVIEIGLQKRVVGEVYMVKVLGGFATIDMESQQLAWKVVAVDVGEANAAHLNDISDVNKSYPGLLEEVREWLRICHCTSEEGSNIKFGLNERAADRQTMMVEIVEAHARWQSLNGSRRHLKSLRQHWKSSAIVRPIPLSNPEPTKESEDQNRELDSSIETTVFSAYVPDFLKLRARRNRPAYFDNTSLRQFQTQEGSMEPLPRVRGPKSGSFSDREKIKQLTIRTSEGLKPVDRTWSGKLPSRPGCSLPRRSNPRHSPRELGDVSQDLRCRTSVDHLVKPVRSHAMGVEGNDDMAIATPILEDDEDIPLAEVLVREEDPSEALVEELKRPFQSLSVSVKDEEGKEREEEEFIDTSVVLSRSSSGSTCKTESFSPSAVSPAGTLSSSEKRRGQRMRDRKVSWGWVEEVEIPARAGDGLARRERPRRETGRVSGRTMSLPVESNGCPEMVIQEMLGRIKGPVGK